LINAPSRSAEVTVELVEAVYFVVTAKLNGLGLDGLLVNATIGGKSLFNGTTN